MQKSRRLPGWLKMQRASGENYSRIKQLTARNHLNTICTSGNCPNKGECWNAGTATFMILGDICTRSCKFCSTKTGRPQPPDPDEPLRLAEAIRVLELKHCVITSVDRDDLSDSGSEFWADTIRKVKEINPYTTIEALIPDFDGIKGNLDRVLNSDPEIVSHNIETVRRLTPRIRSRAQYDRSLDVLRYVSQNGKKSKSGLMLGLDEKEEEVKVTIRDLYDTGCRILTIGQYLQPSENNISPAAYITPFEFSEYERFALETGFEFVECGPLVRSSFHAEKHVGSDKNSYLVKSVEKI